MSYDEDKNREKKKEEFTWYIEKNGKVPKYKAENN